MIMRFGKSIEVVIRGSSGFTFAGSAINEFSLAFRDQ